MAALERNWGMVDRALDGMDEATMARRPNEHCNSVAWTLWHMNRVMDIFVHTRLRGRPQVWLEEGWNQGFGLSDDPDLRGVGWTAEEVGAWTPPGKEIQLGYYEAVKASCRMILACLSQSDLDNRDARGVQLGGGRVMPPPEERRTVSAALGVVVWDNIVHGGQIAYLRGYYLGMGWHS